MRHCNMNNLTRVMKYSLSKGGPVHKINVMKTKRWKKKWDEKEQKKFARFGLLRLINISLTLSTFMTMFVLLWGISEGKVIDQMLDPVCRCQNQITSAICQSGYFAFQPVMCVLF